jgi:hypothetical protein
MQDDDFTEVLQRLNATEARLSALRDGHRFAAAQGMRHLLPSLQLAIDSKSAEAERLRREAQARRSA